MSQATVPRTTITTEQRLQLVGLFTIARQAYREQTQCERAIYRLLDRDVDDVGSGDPPTGDVIWEGRDVDWFLEQAGVTVTDYQDPPCEPTRGIHTFAEDADTCLCRAVTALREEIAAARVGAD